MGAAGPIELDHLVLPVRDARRAAAFYSGLLGLAVEGEEAFARSEVPNLVLRVNEAATLDLIAMAADETPSSIHLALAVSRPAFEEVQRRLDGLGIPWRGSVVRGERPGDVGRTHGSRGRAPSLLLRGRGRSLHRDPEP
jgi:catechol 2,3-dioxygenase-like lactoylglutathione lyase family enzyme